ncbi:MAG: hypothetical protein WBW33_27915 [Bryobacteraceae bacterium]
MKLFAAAVLALFGRQVFASDVGAGRVFQTVVPALPYTTSCRSRVVLMNTSDTPVKIEVEGHAETGALVPLSGHASRTWLGPDEQIEYRLQLEGQSEGAWVKVREYLPAGQDSPAIAIRPASECVVGNELRSTTRQVAFPMRSPWFSGSVAELHEASIWLVNVSAVPVHASACYSSGSYYIIPSGSAREQEARPPRPATICSISEQVQVAPFASRQFPVERDGNSHFSLHTEGAAIVLQALRPIDIGVHVYAVDSSITFLSEDGASGAGNH